jgi:hypothetical protein
MRRIRGQDCRTRTLCRGTYPERVPKPGISAIPMPMQQNPSVRTGAGAIALALALALAACAPQRAAAPPPHILPPPAEAAAWWRASGDAVLDRLVAEAPPLRDRLTCDAPVHHAIALTGEPREARADRLARAWDHADTRLHQAQDIAQAYFRARNWQARVAERAGLPDALKDTAQIAHFRSEAGLVPGLDEDTAGLAVGLNASDLDAARAAYGQAVDDLARLTGQDPVVLRKLLDDNPPVPLASGGDADLLPGTRPDLRALALRLLNDPALHHLDQAAVDAALKADTAPTDAPWATRWATALAAARAQEKDGASAIVAAQAMLQSRVALADSAQKTLADARLAYRAGADGYPAVYIAQAAALSAREGALNAAHAVSTAVVRLWTVQGRGETPQGDTCGPD